MSAPRVLLAAREAANAGARECGIPGERFHDWAQSWVEPGPLQARHGRERAKAAGELAHRIVREGKGTAMPKLDTLFQRAAYAIEVFDDDVSHAAVSKLTNEVKRRLGRR